MIIDLNLKFNRFGLPVLCAVLVLLRALNIATPLVWDLALGMFAYAVTQFVTWVGYRSKRQEWDVQAKAEFLSGMFFVSLGMGAVVVILSAVVYLLILH